MNSKNNHIWFDYIEIFINWWFDAFDVSLSRWSIDSKPHHRWNMRCYMECYLSGGDTTIKKRNGYTLLKNLKKKI